jgi:flagellar assembly protein FliH
MEAERERARVRGYAEGHAEGYRAGMAAAAQSLAQAEAEARARDADRERTVAATLAALRDAGAELSARTHELTAAAEERILAGAVELAEVILAAELAAPGDSATAALRRALAPVDAREASRVRLNPQDLEVIAQTGFLPEDVELEPDATLSRGDAVVVLEDGVVDARVAAALERARRAVPEAAP